MSKIIRESNTRSPVLKVTISDLVTNKVVFIETQEELVLAVAASNKKLHCRTEGTPFRIQSLLQDFYYYADNKVNIEKVLNRTYTCPPTTNKYTKEFIKSLKMLDSIKERSTIDFRITPAHHKEGWKKQNTKMAYDYLSLTHKYYKTSILLIEHLLSLCHEKCVTIFIVILV